MRLKTFIFISLLLGSLKVFAQAKGPEAYLGCASFNTPSGTSYFETYITISGNSLVFGKNTNGQYEGKVKISVQFTQGDSVKASDAYNVLSPFIVDTNKKLTLREVNVPAAADRDDTVLVNRNIDSANKRPDFSAVRRYWLPKGEYSIEIKIEDKNNPTAKVVSVKGKVNIGYSIDTIAISDAELLMSYSETKKPGSLTKNGYDMVPYVYSFYPAEIRALNFYTEIYNTAKILPSSKFVIKYYIESDDSHTALSDYIKWTVHESDTVVPILGGFNIEKLHTGRYNLVVEVIDKNDKKLASREYNFIRNNPIDNQNVVNKNLVEVSIAGTFVAEIRNKDSLREFVKCLTPIANSDDRYFIDLVNSKTDTVLLKRFFYNFWVSHNPVDPKKAWNDYYLQVQLVNHKFGTSYKKGYQTDRGRVYLEYGAPSQRDQSTINADSYPYEIWEYYKLADGESDKKFIFYEPSLATNDFVLLHSTVKGEVQNRQWQQVLYGQLLMPPTSIDQNNLPIPSQTGDNVLDEFNNPR